MNEQLIAGALGGFTLGVARLVLSAHQLRSQKVDNPKWGQLLGAGAAATVVFTVLGLVTAWAVSGGPSGAFITSMAVLISLVFLATASLGDRANESETAIQEKSEALLARVSQLQKEAADAQQLASVHKDQAEAVANILKSEYQKTAKQSRASNLLYFLAGVLASIAVTLFVRPIG